MNDSENLPTSGYVVDIDSESDFTAGGGPTTDSPISASAMCQSRAMHVCSQP